MSGEQPDSIRPSLSGAAPVTPIPPSRWRLSMQGRLALGVLVAGLPLLAAAIWQASGTAARCQLLVLGILSLGLGLVTTTWAYRPLSGLAARARQLAGLRQDSRHLLGLFRRDAAGDRMMSLALDRIEQSLQEIQSLNRIGSMVASNDDFPAILQAIAEQAVALLGADAGLIGRWDAERELFQDIAACNLPIMFPDREFGSRDSLSSQVAHSGQILYVSDYQNYPFRLKELDRFRFRAALGVPLLVGDECKGALVALSVDPDRQFSDRDGQLLLAFASQAAAVFDKARLHQLALEQLSALAQVKEELARESQELERALTDMVRVQEEERARIAADVHDGVVQLMVGSLCELQAAMAHFPEAPESARQKQARARDLIRDSIIELRRVIFDLRPITLDSAGLVPAVLSLAEELEGLSGMTIRVSTVGSPCRFRSETEINAYRIVQEALSNALKHSGALSVNVGIRFAEENLEITVSDDGRGFSIPETASSHGDRAGLIGMRERARSLGGKLFISSDGQAGTVVRAVIPCRPATRDERVGPLDMVPQPIPSPEKDRETAERAQG
jgi:signal transduction histidine kinase